MSRVVPHNAALIPDHAKRVFAGNIFDVYQWPQKMFDGSTKTFEMLKRPDTVVILGINDNKIIVLEEEQPNLSAYYGLPGGRCDVEGESRLDAAKREMVEETGHYFKQWKLLEVTQPQTKIEWFIYLYLAYDIEKILDHTPENDGEKITIMYKTLEETKRMLHDPKTRYLPTELLNKTSTIDALLTMPAFEGTILSRH